MNSYHILFVEDTTSLLAEYKMILEKKGYKVDTAENGQVGLQLWEENIYDLVIADLRMPELDGMDLIKILKSKQPLIQVIILSGQGRDNDMIDAINNDVYRYLKKPVHFKDLINTVKDAIDNRDPALLSLDQMVQKSPEKPEIFFGGEPYTPIRIYNELRKGSDFGKNFYSGFIKTLTEFEPFDSSIDELLDINDITD